MDDEDENEEDKPCDMTMTMAWSLFRHVGAVKKQVKDKVMSRIA